MRPWLKRKFAMECEQMSIQGPCLIVANHVTNWDPLLLTVCSPETPVYFIASEHLFRHGLLSRLVEWVAQPISRSKGTVASDTVKAALRHLKAGHAVAVFAEGDATWDGRSAAVFPATGKLAKLSGGSLITFRLEGGYLSLPRWGHGVRRGWMRGHPVHVYSPEELKTMKAEEVTAAINRDIREDAWQRQRTRPVNYRGRRLAEGMETGLFLCPGCERFGTLRTEDDRIFCACGFTRRYTERGFFEPGEPFESFAEWEDWQQKSLRERVFPSGETLFSDGEVSLAQICPGHREHRLGRGTLLQEADTLRFGSLRFPLKEIGGMALVKSQRLLFTHGDNYYECRGAGRANFRKYLSLWKIFKEKEQ